MFNAACKAAAAKLLGVDKVRVIWSDSAAWQKYADADEGFPGEDAGASVTVNVSDVIGDPEEYDESGVETLTLVGDFVRGEFNDYGGGDDPHFYVPVKAKKIKEDTLNEKVVTLKNPAIKPRGAPEDKARAFDKVNARTGARKNRSVLKAMEKAKPDQEYFALDVSEDPDYTMVLVMKAGLYDHDYYGVNVLFYPDGRIEASTGDSLADKQWEKNKREIIKVAKKQLRTGAPMGDTDADVRAYHGAGDGDYSGYKDKKMNEGKLTFKEFLLAEVKKIKEPGWYVCDHMDKPVDGPMQERGAKELAAEMNEKHAAKNGKGDIDPYSAEYFSDYEIKRMNEASDAKRLAKQNVEAILKAKTMVKWARKDCEADPTCEKSKAALVKAKKKLAALTESDELSAAQKKALMADFEQWSGGFTPDDCDDAQVKQYIKSGMSADLPKEAAIAYLKYIADNGARNAP
jgi:hypothetical protein